MLIEARDLRRTFGTGPNTVHAVNGIDLEIGEGEYVAIRGTSGSGKSTLLQILGLLDRATSGVHRYRGRDVHEIPDRELTRVRNEEIGFVFQSFHLLRDRTAEENVRLPLDYRHGGEPPHDPAAMLERVGLGARLHHRPGELSGGECQRVAIARALVKKPRLILFDEPTGNLDTKTGTGILELLDELHREEKTTLLVVTHDARVSDRAERALFMEDGNWRTEDPE